MTHPQPRVDSDSAAYILAASEHARPKRQLIDWTASILAVAALGGLGGRLLLAPMEPVSVAFTLAFFAGCLLVPGIARWWSVEGAGALLVFLVLSLLTSVGYFAGGLNAPVLALIPVVPALAVAMLGTRSGLALTAVVIGVIAWFGYLDAIGHPFEQRLTAERFRQVRALMLAVAGVLTAAIVLAYERHNQRLRSELRSQAAEDPLTGLANRRQVNAALAYEWSRSVRDESPISVILLDVDHFKLYNDRYGHQAGDDCLRSIADISRRTIRRTTDIVARYGGEEFLAILPMTTHEAALRVGEELRAALERSAIAHDAAPGGVVTVSVGVATSTRSNAMSAELLLQEADAALYRAKAGGRNSVEAWCQPPGPRPDYERDGPASVV